MTHLEYIYHQGRQLMPPLDIKFVNTDELINEVFNRYDHVIFTGIRDGYDGKDTIRKTRRYKGNSETCIGLCERMSIVIHDDESDREDATDT